MPDEEPLATTPEDASDDVPAPAAVTGPRTLVPRWLAVLVLLVLMLASGAAGFALHAALTRSPQERASELDAIEAWRKRLAESPRDVASRLALAEALQQSGRPRSALAEYDEVLRVDPRDTAALYERGTILQQLGQAREAETAFWDVLEQDSGHVLAAEALGDYYASKHQYRSLIEAVRPAVDAHPTEARLQYLMGLAYENLGHADWAESRYKLALDAVPDMSEALEGIDRLKQAQE